MRLDKRPHIQTDSLKGVQVFGSSRVCAVAEDNARRTSAYCGKTVQVAKKARRAVSCPGCVRELRFLGYAG